MESVPLWVEMESVVASASLVEIESVVASTSLVGMKSVGPSVGITALVIIFRN